MSTQWFMADPAPPDEFALTIAAADPLLVSFAGELDIVSADDAWWMLKASTRPGDSVVLDLADLTFIDSSGVLVIERLAQRLADGMLVLVNPRPMARRLLSLTGTTQRSNVSLGPPPVDQPALLERAVASFG